MQDKICIIITLTAQCFVYNLAFVKFEILFGVKSANEELS